MCTAPSMFGFQEANTVREAYPGRWQCLPSVETAIFWYLRVLHIMEYGSTPYGGMGPKKMAAALNVYKMVCSKVYFTCSHKPFRAIPFILECFHQQQDPRVCKQKKCNKTLNIAG